jgi:hypothetical protein
LTYRRKRGFHPSVARSSADEALAEQSAPQPLTNEQLRETIWMQQRKGVAMYDNVLMGATAICKYMRISAFHTMIRWIDDYGFPAIKTPDGKWFTTTSAIDQWIWMASELESKRRMAAKQKVVLRNAGDDSKPPRITSGHSYTSSDIERSMRSGGDGSDVLVRSAVRQAVNGWKPNE